MIKTVSANGHTPGDDATCTTPQFCEDCGTVLENAHGHHYETKTVEPTCTTMGYTVYTCEHCGDTYNSNYTDKAEHDYKEAVTKPTCTSHGYTTYSCKNCDGEYVSDYKENLSHNYNAVVTATHTDSTIANAFEKLRGAMLHHRYVIKFLDMWKSAKTFEVESLKIKYGDYMAVASELKSKIGERKKNQAEKDTMSPIKIFRHRELTQAINELSEQIEELKTERNTILSSLNTTDIKSVKDKIETISKAMPVMEKHSAESTTKLDEAQKEYANLKEQAEQFDEDELFSERYKIRPQVERDTISDLYWIYGNSFATNVFDEVKSETDKSIGETEKRSIIKRLEKVKHKTKEKQPDKRKFENER